MNDRPTFHTLAFDCPEPPALAAFYADLLGYAVSPDIYVDWVTITGPGPQLSFQRAPDHVPPTPAPPADLASGGIMRKAYPTLHPGARCAAQRARVTPNATAPVTVSCSQPMRAIAAPSAAVPSMR